MEQLNFFSKGMNSDLDPLVLNKEFYQRALNFRLITEKGGSTPSLINIKGNDIRSSIPNTTDVAKVNLVLTAGATNITINGQTGAGITISTSSTIDDLYNYIISDPAYTYCAQNSSYTSLSSNTYNIYYNNNYLFIVGELSGTTTVTQNTVSASALNFRINIDSTYIPAQSNLYIIGSTFIRDDIYLFTTSDTSQNPGGHISNITNDPSSVGQIWKLEYDILNDENTLKLIYNNYVDFTAQHPIPHNAVLGRYENSTIKRLYWTDNFNKLRSINVADDQIFALDVSLLDVKPSTDFSRPELQRIISGGSLLAGVYEATYRLKNTNGSVTKTAPLSNVVNIVSSSEASATGGGNFSLYYGNTVGTNTGKAIIWKINDIDTDYERIEIIVTFRENLTDVPTDISIISDEPIPVNGIYEFTYTGNEDAIDFSLDDLLMIDDSFTHCKTISTKDNRLFAGNLRLNKSNINYDSRAYRFPISSNNFDITDNGNTNTYNTSNWTTIREESDAINANSITQRYKQSSTILGGSGPNISYEFGTVAVRADSVIELVAGSLSPYRHTNPEYGLTYLNLLVKDRSENDQLYPSNTINDDIKYPYLAGLFKGYQPGETYRFGITFFDKNGNPYYTKWIGDITMPDYTDECPTNNALFEDFTVVPLSAYTSSAIKDFRPSFIHNKNGTEECFVNQLYVKFDINIPSDLTEEISGYSISRVERTNDDKTILGTGILNQTISDGGALWLPDIQETDAGAGSDFPYLNIDTDGSASLESRNTTALLDCPEFLLNGFPGYQTNDSIKVIGRIALGNTVTSIQLSGAGDPYLIYKYYDIDATYSGSTHTYSLEEAAVCDTASTYSFTGATNTSWVFNNYTRTDGSPGSTGSDAIGSRTLCLGLSSTLDFNTGGGVYNYGCTESNAKKLLAQYVRSVSNQYGGNTYNQRSNNEYIICSHFRPLNTKVTLTTDEFLTFGGDVYSQVYDNQKEIKNWDGLGLGAYSAGDGGTPGSNASKCSVTQYFPCLSSHNTDLRHGTHVNKDLLLDDGSGASGSESYSYNTVYSNISNIKKYVSRPSVYSDVIEYDNRIWASELKINGELSDSWGVFLSDNYWDVEGSYGPINALEVLQDKMFFLQDNAFGIVSINPRVLIPDANGTAIQLGTGNIIQRHDYISTESGTKHQWSVIKSPNSLLWFDANVKKIFRFNSNLDQLSDAKGIRGYLNENLNGNILVLDNPIYKNSIVRNQGVGVHGCYDYKYNEFFITFNNIVDGETGSETIDITDNFTLCFNEEVDSFTSFYSFTPNHYISNHREIYTSDRSYKSDLYLHDRGEYCKFYNTNDYSELSLVVNPNPNYNKVFDNLEWITESIDDSNINITKDTWDQIRVRNNYQNTDYQLLVDGVNVKRKERTFKYAIARNRVNYSTQNADIYNDLSTTRKQFGERIRDKYIIIDLRYYNNDNYNFTCKLINTHFRPSFR